MPISISFDPITLSFLLFTWEYKLVRGVFDWLEELLSAKLMFVAFAIAFALCSKIQIAALGMPSVLPQLEPVLQVSIFCTFAAALLTCGLAVVAIVTDAVYKHVTRTPITFVDHFEP